MELRNSFEIAAPPARVWAFLLDVERVVPCMPGAQLTQVIDERSWKGRVNVKLGPVSMSFAGTVQMAEQDDENRRVTMKAKGMESRGKGMASAVVRSGVEAADGGSRVDIVTDLKISGAAAQYGRGMIGDVSQKFTAEFARELAERLREADADNGQLPAPNEGKPDGRTPDGRTPAISGFRLGLWALYRALVRGLKRLFGKME